MGQNYIAKMRQQYPMYKDIDDVTLAKAYHKKHYSDLDEDVFMDKIGLHQPTFTEKASKAIRETLEPILPSSTPKSASQRYREEMAQQPQPQPIQPKPSDAFNPFTIPQNVSEDSTTTRPFTMSKPTAKEEFDGTFVPKMLSPAEQDKQVQEQNAKTFSTQTELSDYGNAIMKGAANLYKAGGWAVGEIGEGIGSDGLKEYGQAMRDTGDESAKYWDDGLSQAAKEARDVKFVARDDNGDVSVGDTLNNIVNNPATVGLMAGESLPATGLGMGLGGFVTKAFTLIPQVGTKVASAFGYGLGEGAVASASSGVATEDSVLSMKHEKLMEHPEYRAVYLATGDEAKAKKIIADAAGDDAAALTFVTTTLLSSPFGYTMSHLFSPADDAAKLVRENVVNNAMKDGAGELGQETLQSGAEQIAQNFSINQHADTSVGLGDNVLESMVAGGVAGLGMGSAMGAGQTAMNNRKVTQYENALETQRDAMIQDQYNRAMMGGGMEMQLSGDPLESFAAGVDARINTIRSSLTNLSINHPEFTIPEEAKSDPVIAETIIAEAEAQGLNLSDNNGLNQIDTSFAQLADEMGVDLTPVANTVQEPIEQTQPIIEKPIIGQPEPEAVVKYNLTAQPINTDRLKELEAIPDDELTVEQQWELEDLRKAQEDKNFTGENNVGTTASVNSDGGSVSDSVGVDVDSVAIDKDRLELMDMLMSNALEVNKHLLKQVEASHKKSSAEYLHVPSPINKLQLDFDNKYLLAIREVIKKQQSSATTSENPTAVQETGVGSEAKPTGMDQIRADIAQLTTPQAKTEEAQSEATPITYSEPSNAIRSKYIAKRQKELDDDYARWMENAKGNPEAEANYSRMYEERKDAIGTRFDGTMKSILNDFDNKIFERLYSRVVNGIGFEHYKQVLLHERGIDFGKTKKSAEAALEKHFGNEYAQWKIDREQARNDENEQRRIEKIESDLSASKIRSDGEVMTRKEWVEKIYNNGFVDIRTEKKGAVNRYYAWSGESGYEIKKQDADYMAILQKRNAIAEVNDETADEYDALIDGLFKGTLGKDQTERLEEIDAQIQETIGDENGNETATPTTQEQGVQPLQDVQSTGEQPRGSESANVGSVPANVKIVFDVNKVYSTKGINHEYPNNTVSKRIQKDVAKYVQQLSKALGGWEVATDKKGKPLPFMGVSDNLPPAGGSVSFKLFKPNTDIGVYVSIDIGQSEDQDGEDAYAFNDRWGIGELYRLTYKGKSKDGQNRYVKTENLTSPEFVRDIMEMVDREATKQEAKAQEAKNDTTTTTETPNSVGVHQPAQPILYDGTDTPRGDIQEGVQRDGETPNTGGVSDTQIRGDDVGTPIANGSGDGSANGERDSGTPTYHRVTESNFVLQDDSPIIKGKVTRYSANVRAIKLLHENKKTYSAEDKVALSQFTGWGGLQEAFYRNGEATKGWEDRARELKNLLTTEEYEAAERSVLDAFYTPASVINSMWSISARLGFNGGRVLEPSVGVGRFIGLTPSNLKSSTAFNAVELDPTTAKIAKILYGKANVRNAGFQETTYRGDHAMVIGNPPYGDTPIYDKNNKQYNGMNIHNYFMVRSLDALQDGGILNFVVSSSFLDTLNPKAVGLINSKAKMIGAIRLPSNVFSDTGTKVTTDIVIFQKLRGGEVGNKEVWAKNGELNGIKINQYFINNPSMMIGEWEAGYRGKGQAVLKSGDMDVLLKTAIDTLPSDIMNVNTDTTMAESSRMDTDNIPPNNLFVDNGVLYFNVRNGEGMTREVASNIPATVTKAVKMLEMKDELLTLIAAQLDPTMSDVEVEKIRTSLNKKYDAFVAKNKFLNSSHNASAIRNDRNAELLLSLEKGYDKGVSEAVSKTTKEPVRAPSAEKADILTRRTAKPKADIAKTQNVKEALTITLNERGGIDLSYMEKITDKSREVLLQELEGEVFYDEEAGYVTKDVFLSGDVKTKLSYTTNENARKALEAVIPADLEAKDIIPTIGSSWISPTVIEQFMSEELGYRNAKASYISTSGKWNFSGYTYSSKYGTKRRKSDDILKSALNSSPIKVFDTIDKKPVLNKVETDLATSQVEQLGQHFIRWAYSDTERRNELVATYNEEFNRYVPMTTNIAAADYIIPNMSEIFIPREHQRNAVYRAVFGQYPLLLNHIVGSGKTLTSQMIAMEWRRLGKANKPIIVTLKSVVPQYIKEFKEAYPNANVLTPSESDFDKNKRRMFLSRIATGDYDAIVMTHDQLQKLKNPQSIELDILRDEKEAAIESARQAAENKDSKTVGDIQKIIEKINIKIEKLTDVEKDDMLSFDQLGIDGIIVDEAHYFKKLAYTSSLGRVAGMPEQGGSKRAFDLFVKTQYILKSNNGRNVVFMTGTPITNAIPEAYLLQKFLQYDELKAHGLLTFDAWAKNYTDITTDYELSPTGSFKEKPRMKDFQNIKSLMATMGNILDTVNNDDVKKSDPSFKLPELKGGKPTMVFIEPSQAQLDYVGQPDENGNYAEGTLVYRSEHMTKEGKDNHLLLFTDASKMAIDIRMVLPNAEDSADSKINATVANVLAKYKEFDHVKGTQLIFSDMGTPKGGGKAKAELEDLIRRADAGDTEAEEELDGWSEAEIDDVLNGGTFSVYDDIKIKLIRGGVPADQIAFVHDYPTKKAKEALSDAVKAGKIRIVLGSTGKLGTGVNVQERLVAVHHIDIPHTPAELQQRNGRIIRQGNKLVQEIDGFKVEIFYYATKKTLDGLKWQTLERKAKFIEAFLRGDSVESDGDMEVSMSELAEQMKALASGNELLLEKMKKQRALQKLEQLKTAHELERNVTRDKIAQFEKFLAGVDNEVQWLENDIAQFGDKPLVTIGKKTYDKPSEFGEAIVLLAMKQAEKNTAAESIGSIGKIDISIKYDGIDSTTLTFKGDTTNTLQFKTLNQSSTGLGVRIGNVKTEMVKKAASLREAKITATEALPRLRKNLTDDFEKQDELNTTRIELNNINEQIADGAKPKQPKQANGEDMGGGTHAMYIPKSMMTIDDMKQVLLDSRAMYQEIPYDRLEWDKLFPNNGIDTHIGFVTFGENQFEKLDPNTKDPKNHDRNKQDRRKHIFYIYEVLKNPALIIDNGEGAYVFIKEFDKPDASTRRYASIVITKHSNNVVISSHNMKYSQIFNEIEKGEIVYPVGVTANGSTTYHPTPTIVDIKSIPQPSVQTKEDNIDEHFARVNGYDLQGINFVPTYRVSGYPSRPDSNVITLGDRVVKLPTREEPITADSVRVYLKDIIGNRLYEAKLHNNKALGIYRERDSSIRLQSYSDIEVMAHEMAHYLDYFHKNPDKKATTSWFRKEILKNKEEIKAVSYTTDPKQVVSEGFAEFVRLWLTNYNAAVMVAPNMVKDFEARLQDDRALNTKMLRLQEGMHQFYYQGAGTRKHQGGELNSAAQRIKWSQRQFGMEYRQKIIDSIHSIKRIEADVKGDVASDAMNSPYKALQLVNGYSGVVYSALNFGVPTIKNGDITYSGKPLNQIFEPASKHGEERIRKLMDYFVARRAEELMEQGREKLITAQDIEADLKLAEEYPEFETIFDEYQQFNEAMLDFYVAMDYITETQRENFLENNKNYVPFHRIIESVQNGKTVQMSNIAKRLTGGTHSLGDIMENILGGLENNIKQAMISRGKTMFYTMLEESGMGGVYATRVPTETEAYKADILQQAKNIANVLVQLDISVSEDGLINQGKRMPNDAVSVDEITDALMDNPDLITFFSHGHPPQAGSGSYIDSVIMYGTRVYFETKDAGLIEAMQSFNSIHHNIAMQWLMSVKNIMTWNITNNPLFYLTNFARDTVSGAALSKNGFIPVLSSVRGMYHFVTQSQVYKDFMTSGAGYGTLRATSGNKANAMRMLNVNRGLDVFNKIISGLAYGADMFEYGTRLGEFELAQKAGKTNWQAAFEGREISTDFAIKGSETTITSLMATVPFMKAAINGIDKTARRIFSLNGEMKLSNMAKFRNAHDELIGHKVKLYAAGSIIALASLALFMANKDDERYKRLTKDQKMMYWNIFVGDKHIKIPKPYDIGFVFASLPEIIANGIYTKHGQDALDEFLLGIKTMFSIGDVSGMFQPMLDHAMNKNWMGSPIVPANLQNVEDKADQYTEGTKLIYRKIGENTGLSPIMTQHYVDGYLGLTAKMIEEATENILWNKEQWGERPFARNPVEFLTYRFHGKPEESRTYWSEKYYEISKRAEAVNNSYKLKEDKAVRDGGDAVREYVSDNEHRTLIGINNLTNRMDRSLGQLKNDLEYITYDKMKTAKEKEKIINDAYKAKREALEKIVTALDQELKKVEK